MPPFKPPKYLGNWTIRHNCKANWDFPTALSPTISIIPLLVGKPPWSVLFKILSPRDNFSFCFSWFNSNADFGFKGYISFETSAINDCISSVFNFVFVLILFIESNNKSVHVS